jgi:ABC-type Mn2+/Zn2+ transport system ATPase subunit
MLVEVREAVFGYAGRPVVRLERLELRAGRCVGIFGPNGAGKTTLVRGIVGLLPPLAGVIRRMQPNLRVGYLPQHRAMEMHWPMSGLDVACLAASARRRLGWARSVFPRVCSELSLLDASALARRHFATLSGGQQQRVMLAGALVADPQVLVLDEPTDGLDVHSRRMLLERLASARQKGLCTILISHEPRDLLAIADEILIVEPAEEEDQPSVALPVDAAHLAEHVMGAAAT